MRIPVTQSAQQRVYSPAWWQVLGVANISAGLGAIIIYIAGPLPLYLGAMAQMDAPADLARSGLVVAFFAAGAGTIFLALWTRQPLAVGWSLPGLLYLVSASQRYDVEALVGASLVSGIVLLALGVSGAAGAIARLLPMPVVMAVLAGTALHYCTGAVAALETAPLSAGAAAIAFFGARRFARPWMPPIAAALIAGLPVAILTGGSAMSGTTVTMPAFEPALPAFHPGALVTLVPLLVSASLMGNLQAFAIMDLEGYRGHRNLTTVVLGLMSIVQAFFAAPPATMQRASMALLAGKEAGERDYRYVAAIIASLGAIGIALFASPAAALATNLPAGFVSALVGLVLFGIVLDALARGLSSPTPQGAFVAFVVAVSGISAGQLDASLLALAAGVGVSFALKETAAAKAD